MKIDIYNTDKKYNIIYADPPWKYRDKATSGRRGAIYKYPTMSINEICNMPIRSISADNCALFIWTTAPMIDKCFDVIRNWGFCYKTIAFVWIKENKKSKSLFWGMGNWTRANAEICLLATKGKPQRISASVHSVIVSPIEQHSKKPDETRKRIVDLLGDQSKIELFARCQSDGWDCWGNEV